MSALRTAAELEAERDSRAGCRILRRTRAGLLVGLYRNDEANLDADGGPWSVVCEGHGGIVCLDTLEIARSWLSHPEDWCPDCQQLRDGKTCSSPAPESAAPAPAPGR